MSCFAVSLARWPPQQCSDVSLVHRVVPASHNLWVLEVALGLGDGHVDRDEHGGSGADELESFIVRLHIRRSSSPAEEVQDVLEWLCGWWLWM